MRMRICTLLLLLAEAGLGSMAAHGQTDVAASLYGAFNGATNSGGGANSGTISPSNAAGGLIEVRHIKNPLVGFEASYSFNRANQADSSTVTPPCPAGGSSLCGPTTVEAAIPANAHEITGDWVVSLKVANLRPFALAGGGLLFDVPTASSVTATTITCSTVNPLCGMSTSSVATSTQTNGVFVYGAGIDWGLLPHLGLRLQYRGNLYKAPALLSSFTSMNAFTHTAEPVIGAYFRF